MINMKKEKLYSLSQATNFVPSLDDKKIHASTLWRWCKRGCRGVRLEHVRLGRRILTSQEAINRFGNKLAFKEENCYLPSPHQRIQKAESRTDSERQEAIQEAERELQCAGVGQESSNE